jgi:hypothetical protein
VSQQSYERKQLQDLKAAAKELQDLSVGVGRAIDQAAESGDIRAAHEAFAALQSTTAGYEKFRATLSPEVLFVAKYNVDVHGEHQVSFVLPKGVSRMDMLKEANDLVGDRDLIYPAHLTKWEQDPKFTDVATTSQRIYIDGHVAGGDAKTLAEQEAFLNAKELQMPSMEDLAVACVAHYVATRELLFGLYESGGWSFVVRAVGGALRFHSKGLVEYDLSVHSRFAHVAVAAHVSPVAR